MWRSCGKCGRLHRFDEECPVRRMRKETPDSKLRNTYAWHTKAEQIKKDSKYLCSVCLEEGRFNYEDLETHHITKLTEDPDGLLDDYNLITLCVRHHRMADEGKIDPDHLRELARKREEGVE